MQLTPVTIAVSFLSAFKKTCAVTIKNCFSNRGCIFQLPFERNKIKMIIEVIFGLSRSNICVFFAQAPLHPEEVASKHNFYENKFEISVDSPAEGTWHHFEVTYDDFYHPVGKKLAVFDNSSSTGEMKFDRYGAVYQLKVWAVSTNGVKSSYATEHLLLTGEFNLPQLSLAR